MTNSDQKKSIAVIGGGSAGLAAAWHLNVNCPGVEVHLFEAESRLGGHACTVPVPVKDNVGQGNVDVDVDVDVDVGFMVFNEAN